MYDNMWEDNTADLFEEITIEEALSDSPYSVIGKMYEWMKSIKHRELLAHIPKRMPENKGKTIKFRRYSNAKKEVVRDSECETAATLDARWTRWGVLPHNLSRSTYSENEVAEKDLEKQKGSRSNGPSFPEG